MMEMATLSLFIATYPWVLVPIGCAVFLCMTLWLGWIRQPMTVNLITLGLILPCITLSVIAAGAAVVSDALEKGVLSLLAG